MQPWHFDRPPISARAPPSSGRAQRLSTPGLPDESPPALGASLGGSGRSRPLFSRYLSANVNSKPAAKRRD